jgi:hypothetical protein
MPSYLGLFDFELTEPFSRYHVSLNSLLLSLSEETEERKYQNPALMSEPYIGYILYMGCKVESLALDARVYIMFLYREILRDEENFMLYKKYAKSQYASMNDDRFKYDERLENFTLSNPLERADKIFNRFNLLHELKD